MTTPNATGQDQSVNQGTPRPTSNARGELLSLADEYHAQARHLQVISDALPAVLSENQNAAVLAVVRALRRR